MNTEKIAARARKALVVIIAIGGVCLIFGVMAAVTALTSKTLQPVPSLVMFGSGAVLSLTGALMVLLGIFADAAIALTAARETETNRRYEQLMGALEGHAQALEMLRETSSLSDAAKQIAYRAKDREALRQAIREDIEKGDFEQAMSLVTEMERRFGYRHEAEELREQIETGWHAAREREVKESIEQIETSLAHFEWGPAQRQCGRLLRLHPSHDDAKKMPARIQLARDNHKRDLLKQWKEAIVRDDVDRGVSLLKELDQYITPSEAEAYKEAARDVFKKKLQQLGVQFAIHVHDKNSAEALRIGKQIIEEFPNTRIAAEIRERLAILEEKAGQPAAAGT